jgi:hypothetical protein
VRHERFSRPSVDDLNGTDAFVAPIFGLVIDLTPTYVTRRIAAA